MRLRSKCQQLNNCFTRSACKETHPVEDPPCGPSLLTTTFVSALKSRCTFPTVKSLHAVASIGWRPEGRQPLLVYYRSPACMYSFLALPPAVAIPSGTATVPFVLVSAQAALQRALAPSHPLPSAVTVSAGCCATPRPIFAASWPPTPSCTPAALPGTAVSAASC